MKEWEKFRQAWKVVSSELRPLKKQNVQDGGRKKAFISRSPIKCFSYPEARILFTWQINEAGEKK